ncbi:MAG TPA: cupin domain-containing protein [Burkholderiales bacterium]|jgi:hypothetical protein|nr:cupin domain-containing protein [Burkholderiales bacterium]
MSELPPQLRQLRDFYYKTALKLPPEQYFVRAEGLIDAPSFFTVEHLKQHLNNPMLMPNYLALMYQGKRVDLSPAMGHKVIQAAEVPFLNKGILEDYLAHGASLVLEGVDILQADINAMCGAIDAPHECVLSNAVAFFSQKGNEAYGGHLDLDDVLVVHLGGRKKWRIFERQNPRRVDMFELPPEKMGKQVAEFEMQPGDALYMRSKTPHLVETTGDYSLHMSFDICDRNVTPETALHMLMAEFDRDASPSYTPTPGVLERLVAHAGTPAYQAKLAELQAKQRENYKRARAMLGSNRVSALDRWIVQESRTKK